MKKSNRFCLTLLLVLLHAFTLFAGTPRPVLTERTALFNERDVRRKGIDFSEIFTPDVLAFQDIRIKHSAAMRFETDDYEPSPDKPAYMTYEEIQKHLARAQASTESVKATQAFTSLLTGKNIELPIGIKKTVGNKDVIICLDSIIFTPTYAYGILYVIIDDTKNDKQLVFYGSNIRFTKSGGFTGEGRLDLLVTYDLKFGQTADIEFLVDEEHENYVAFDCNGFKRLHVDAQVLFNKEKFLYEDEDGELDPEQQVTVDFMADFQSLDNFIVQISNVPAFQVAGMEGTSFKVNTLAFDYSSEVNPTGITFPDDYDYPAFDTGDENYWEGFYVDGLTVKLPEEFKLKNNTSGRITLNVNQAMIDKLGFTGNINAENVFALKDGDMGGWDYSLDLIDVTFLKSALVEAEFSGSLVIPITKSTQQLDYTAIILPHNEYNFTVELATNLNIPMWGAGGVALYQDSWINVEIANKKFTPTASLNGMMSIGAPVNGADGQAEDGDNESKLALAEIKFTKLLVSTRAPYLSIDPDGGAFGVGSPLLDQKMAKLPISIANVMFMSAANPARSGIKFTVLVNLTGKGDADGGISGNATLTVWGNNHYNNGKTTYSFYKVELNRIELNNVKIAVLTLGGYIEFYRQDPVYGSGFSGGITIKLEIGAGEIGIEAKCIFGKKPLANNPSDVYRYWAVDMLVSLPSIPIFPGIVYLNAIGGGASNRMGMDRARAIANPKFVSTSGVAYVPDEAKGLGLKALIGIQGQSRKLYEGQLIFEVLFNVGGGLSQVSFSGYVQIASVSKFDQLQKLKSSVAGFVDKVKAKPNGVNADKASGADVYGEITRMADGGAIMAQWMMVYDRNNKSFTANLDLFIDVYGVLKGVNPNAHAGRIDILFTPSKWHVFAGLPTYPVGVSVIDFVDITGYFMLGHDLRPPLRMPIPGAPVPYFPMGSQQMTNSGKGFATGARLRVGSKGGGLFYYACFAAVGFDVLIVNVEGQFCNGKQMGIKNWYAFGQAFFYAYGSAGLKSFGFGLPYPCCRDCYSCSRSCWRPWCWGCDWCRAWIEINLNATIDLGFYGMVQAANPTYVEGGFRILGQTVTVKKGKRC